MTRVVLALAVLTTACASDGIVVGSLQEIATIPASPSRDLDILFVIDNSPSMADKQAALARAFPQLLARLEQLDGGMPNLHIGVVTSDMGTQGSTGSQGLSIGTLGMGGCAGAGDDGRLIDKSGLLTSGPYLIDVEDPANPGQRSINYVGSMADQFAKMAQVGEGGCGFEQHLAAMRRAFTQPANAGFLRPTANLAVVIIGDEDDCSVRDPSFFLSDSENHLGPLESYRCFAQGVVCTEGLDQPGDKHACRPRVGGQYIDAVDTFRDALLALKPNPKQILLAGIVGAATPVSVTQAPPLGLQLAPSCTFTTSGGPAIAYPSTRLTALVHDFPGLRAMGSVCGDDISASLTSLGETTKQLMGDTCISPTGLIDTSAAAGLQPACQVTQDTGGSSAQLAIPLCGSAPPSGATSTCYTLAPDATACPQVAGAPESLRLTVHQASAPPASAMIHVSCQVEPDYSL